ncbi:crosslink repair DNA glycosylase YcaQ family protein [Hyphococcus flavus]|uniref:Crosslink repair DNA glycosylase YcaQ family protein n=1 Tax=Hyphococcus flavus TaxID=1866326 RepID=A0AAE9ZDY1_9PROT|nr:crosslink repair DNA glycosylase YcaQ family protein [Hyphococcus flavus]WDI30752.1 crosslink repair DNA glycosylase YcaQ family protein [Hyphococcus flavus]
MLTISNRDARRLWLTRQGLAAQPTGALDQAGLMAIIDGLGFVQLDTIRIIARAHDHILWSRNQNYRESMLDDLVKDRLAFEHFTHDASVLPMEYYPYWRRQFGRMIEKITKSRWGAFMPPKKERDKIYNRVAAEGPLCSGDFKAAPGASRKEGWARPPHKFVLDGLWYGGELATCHRRNFIKYYAVREKVIPPKMLNNTVSDARAVEWLCSGALERMGFATAGDIQRYWDAVSLDEVKAWLKKRKSQLMEVKVTCADGAHFHAFAPCDIKERIDQLKAPTSRLRLLNPFDPVVRDRNRLQRLFGFDYRNEMFTPAAKRQYGYYIYPILEGERMIGRIEAKADRKKETITVDNVWWETKVKATAARLKKLDAELDRMGRFVGCGKVARKAGNR